MIYDALIIGGGPAGLAAALSYARVIRSVIVFDSGEYRNAGIKHMHTVPSRDHSHPEDFRSTAREQMKRYPHVVFKRVQITEAKEKKTANGFAGFELKDNGGETYVGRKLILATGSKDVLPEIEGYKENWPSHIYQCLGCDGFEQRGTPIGVLGFTGPQDAFQTTMALAFDNRVTVFSNGPVGDSAPIQAALAQVTARGVKVDDRKIKRHFSRSKDGICDEKKQESNKWLANHLVIHVDLR